MEHIDIKRMHETALEQARVEIQVAILCFERGVPPVLTLGCLVVVTVAVCVALADLNRRVTRTAEDLEILRDDLDSALSYIREKIGP